MSDLEIALEKNNFTVITCGGGVNFTALIYEWYKRKMPRPDLIIFADTGSERPRTYQHITIMNNWLFSVGYPQITICHVQDAKTGDQVKIHDLCLKTKTLPPPAFGFKSCSLRFKTEQVDKFLNNYTPTKNVWGKYTRLSQIKNKVTRVIGFDAGEDHRVGNFSCEKYDVVFPLVEWDIDREECEEIIKDSPLPKPIKSSCYMCPNMKTEEIMEMAENDPESLNAALAVEDAYLSSDNAKGRHVDVELLRNIETNELIGLVNDMDKIKLNYLLGIKPTPKTYEDEFDLSSSELKATAYISKEKVYQPSKIRGLGRTHSWREVLANPQLNVGNDANCVCSEG